MNYVYYNIERLFFTLSLTGIITSEPQPLGHCGVVMVICIVFFALTLMFLKDISHLGQYLLYHKYIVVFLLSSVGSPIIILGHDCSTSELIPNVFCFSLLSKRTYLHLATAMAI